jgi:uncharacterized protein DUF6326
MTDFQVRVTIAALWVSAMMCYVYADLIAFFDPGNLQAILAGHMGAWKTTPALLMGAAVMLSIPSLMISVTLIARPALARWLNVAMGVVHALIAIAQTIGAWAPRTYYYMYFGVIEFVLTLLIAWYAFRRLPLTQPTS